MTESNEHQRFNNSFYLKRRPGASPIVVRAMQIHNIYSSLPYLYDFSYPSMAEVTETLKMYLYILSLC